MEDWQILGPADSKIAVVISKTVVNDMLAHAREEAPRECCGLLIGGDGIVERAMRARNTDDDPTRRYLIDPADHFAAIRAAREMHREVIGAYHSHPSSAPVPSPADLAEASNGSEFLYVIVSPWNGDVLAYRYDREGFRNCPLTLTP